MMPTMRNIELLEAHALHDLDDENEMKAIINDVCAAARRGVGADKDLNEMYAERCRLAREIDVAMHGEKDAAKQASLCDLVPSARWLRERVEKAEAEIASLRSRIESYLQEGAVQLARADKAEAELAALKATQTDQRGPDAQDNAGAGIDAASQARCEHSGGGSMTPERVAFYAEQAWPAGHEETSVRAIERAIRQAVNEALEEAANLLDAEDFAGAAVLGLRVRALKLPEEP